MKFREIDIQPTMWKLDVIVTKNMDRKACDFMSKRYGANWESYYNDASTDSVCTIHGTESSELGSRTRFVMILRGLSEKKIIVHELIHVLYRLEEHIGMEINANSQEWQALMMEYLFDETCKVEKYKTIK